MPTRLDPIEKPASLRMRFAYWLSRRRLGKVPSVLKVVYARDPGFAMLGWRIAQYTEKGTKLSPSLRLLIQAVVAERNGCGFCLDMARAMAVQEDLGLEKFEALPEWRTSPLFDERERAALAYVCEASDDCRVGDATFETLRKHFDETEIVQITVVGAIESFYNRIALPMGLGADGLCAIQQRGATAA